jgi:hypothetical protein
MQKRVFVLAAVVVAATLIVINSHLAAAGRYRVSPPTPAPTATPGPAPTELLQALPTLPGGPLLTPEQVLQQLVEIDRGNAVWEHSWSVETLKSDPARITLKWFPSRTAESGSDGTFGPGLDAAAGPVWRITIQGHVHVSMLTMDVEPDRNTVYDGVTYVTAQNSGALLSVASGAPVPGAAPITLPDLTGQPSQGPYP